MHRGLSNWCCLEGALSQSNQDWKGISQWETTLESPNRKPVPALEISIFWAYLVCHIWTAAWMARCSQINFDFSLQKICKNRSFSRFTSFNFNLMFLINRLAIHWSTWHLCHLYTYHPYFEPIRNHSVHSQSKKV